MSIGADIADVIRELGVAVSIYKHSEEIVYQGHLDYSIYMSSRTPFDSEHMFECTFPYDTLAAVGDKVIFQLNTKEYLLATLVDEIFEEGIVVKEGVLYKCNTTFAIDRISGETRDSDYNLIVNWDSILSGESALFTGDISDQQISDERYARIYTQNRNLFVSTDLDVRQEDRCYINGEAYSVDFVESDRLPGLKICQLSRDTRE